MVDRFRFRVRVRARPLALFGGFRGRSVGGKAGFHSSSRVYAARYEKKITGFFVSNLAASRVLRVLDASIGCSSAFGVRSSWTSVGPQVADSFLA